MNQQGSEIGLGPAAPGEAHGKMSEVADKAKHLGSQAKEQLVHKADERKGMLVEHVDSLAGVFDRMSRNLGDDTPELERKLVGQGAELARKLSSQLRDRSASELFDAASRQIHERPGIFVAGCLALGFLGARILRS